ncbi:MAG: RagB/SusD family nutrient uptake outer membrane protein [Muribaculaceae bacterium]|nr:RagB/SusD family nutrient uptake outer membrane protein [Muribaculaceae bacterium]
MKLNAIKYAMMLAAGAFAAGCTDITDYPDGRMSFDDVFQNPKLVGGYMNSCYISAVGDYGQRYADHTFLASASDEAHDTDDAVGGTMYQWNSGFMTPFSVPWHWIEISGNTVKQREDIWNYYAAIRRCNIMVDRVESATIRLDSERESYRGEARGLRSYYYLELIRNYGGVPLVLDNTTELEDDWGTARKATFSEVAQQIIKDSREVIYDNTFLEWTSGVTDQAMNRWNKAMSAAVMSEAALYAASPLNNDGTITWADAAEICKEALDLCTSNGYALVTRQPENDYLRTSYNAYDYFFTSAIDTRAVNDTESILYAKNRMDAWQYCGRPTTEGQSSAGSCPSQELIDSYETLQGEMPVLGYADADHLQPILNPAAQYDEQNPYENRDPRLMATVYHHGSRLMPLEEDGLVDIREGGNCQVSDNQVRYTRTGYYIRKFSSPSSSRSGNNDGYMRRMRLAELYLNYAEAANEASVDGKAPDRAVRAVNQVRARVGMPELPYGMSQDEFRTRVRNERRVELAYEGHRFYDVRRWKILDQTDKVVTGVKVDADGRYSRFVVSRRNAWQDKFLRLPIPGDEVARLMMQTGVNMQNPGWN